MGEAQPAEPVTDVLEVLSPPRRCRARQIPDSSEDEVDKVTPVKVDQSLAHRLALMSEERKNQLVLERLVRTNPSLYQRLLQEAL